MAKAANPPRIQCNAEWHLRENPRAIGIYGLALHITKAKRPFFLSQPQVAEFFDWDLKTVRAAFKALRDSGLFTLLRKGSGSGNGHANYANVYSVTTHSNLAKDQHPCRPLPETGTLVSKAKENNEGKTGGGSKNGRGGLPETGTLIALPETGTLVSDSPIKSYSDAGAPGKQTPATPGKASPFPDDFTPDDEDRALAEKHGVDIDDALTRFEYYYRGKGTRMADWHASFKGWLMNARDFSRQRPSPPKTTGSLTENYRALRERYP